MKNIKFRGMTSKGWLYGDLIHNRDKVYIAPVGEIYHDAIAEDFEVTDIHSIGQFTGQYDKNGKEIYEGDVIRYYYDPHKKVFSQGIVIYSIGSFEILMNPLKYYNNNQLEVVGNLYYKIKLVMEEERK